LQREVNRTLVESGGAGHRELRVATLAAPVSSVWTRVRARPVPVLGTGAAGAEGLRPTCTEAGGGVSDLGRMAKWISSR